MYKSRLFIHFMIYIKKTAKQQKQILKFSMDTDDGYEMIRNIGNPMMAMLKANKHICIENE